MCWLHWPSRYYFLFPFLPLLSSVMTTLRPLSLAFSMERRLINYPIFHPVRSLSLIWTRKGNPSKGFVVIESRLPCISDWLSVHRRRQKWCGSREALAALFTPFFISLWSILKQSSVVIHMRGKTSSISLDKLRITASISFCLSCLQNSRCDRFWVLTSLARAPAGSAPVRHVAREGGNVAGTDRLVRPSHPVARNRTHCDSAFRVSRVNEMSELGGGCENVALLLIQNTGWIFGNGSTILGICLSPKAYLDYCTDSIWSNSLLVQWKTLLRVLRQPHYGTSLPRPVLLAVKYENVLVMFSHPPTQLNYIPLLSQCSPPLPDAEYLFPSWLFTSSFFVVVVDFFPVWQGRRRKGRMKRDIWYCSRSGNTRFTLSLVSTSFICLAFSLSLSQRCWMSTPKLSSWAVCRHFLLRWCTNAAALSNLMACFVTGDDSDCISYYFLIAAAAGERA